MSVPCPHCKSPLNPKGMKPGRFTPKCPKCGKQFLLVVPDDPNGTIAAKAISAAPDPITQPTPATVVRTPPASTEVTGDFTDADPNATAEPRKPAAEATGDFTEKASPDATGDFTENLDPETTGAFAERKAADADRTGVVEQGDRTVAPNADTQAKVKKKAAGGLDVPDRLGGYEVLSVLGKGGMGAVLLGRQVSLDRKVALKIMHARLAGDPGFVARFTREAYAAAQLNHHNVVQIYDIGEDDGTHYFSMEFVPGRSLTEELKKTGKLDPEAAVGYVLQAARGLRYGHVQGMVHRDVKPDNLLLNTEGVVKVADLGLVKLPSDELAPPGTVPDLPDSAADDGEATERLTRAGQVMGTPSYMAPEQATDSGAVDQRADIYSLGCTLYVLVTGKPPFEGKTAMEVISKHKTEPVVPPEVIVKRVPKALSGMLQKMLAKRPEDRFQTMDEVISALEGFLGLNRTGPFTPKEEQADALEKAVNAFTAASRAGRKKVLALGFAAACVAGIIVLGVIGKAWSFGAAGGVLGLLLMTPLAYFVIHGLRSKTFLFGKARELVLGSRVTDWLMWAGGAILFLAALYVFGLLWYWLGFCVVAVGLAFLAWFLTDRPEEAAREEPLSEARQLFRSMRLQGLEEDTLRQFVAKYGGPNWEEFYEALFGYPEKLSARAYRRGAVTEPAKTHAAWREPVVAWIDARILARRESAERKLLLQVQAKALQAAGVPAAEAKAQAEELADVMVGAAAGAREAVKAGKPADLKGMVAVARAKKRPASGYNIAGVPLRKGRGMGELLDAYFGRRLRFLLGAAVLAVGLLWVNQNKDVFREASKQVTAAAETVGKLDADALKDAATSAGSAAKGAAAKETKPLAFLPAEACHLGLPLSGALLMFTGIFYFGWKPTLAAVPGCLLGVFGPALGVPDLGPVKGWMVSTLAGAVLTLVGGRVLRG